MFVTRKRSNVWYCAAVQDNQIFATDFSLEELDLRRLLRKLPYTIHFQIIEEPNQFQAKVLGVLEEILHMRARSDLSIGGYGYGEQVKKGNSSEREERL